MKSLFLTIIGLSILISCGTEPTPVYTLNTSVNGEGQIGYSVGDMQKITLSSGEEKFDKGESVTLTALPDSGWIFTSWEGETTSTQNPTRFTIDGDKSFTGNFDRFEKQKVRSFGNEFGDYAVGIKILSDGNMIMVYNSNKEDSFFNKTSQDVVVAKINISGEIIWEKTFGGSGTESAQELYTLNDEIYITGIFDSNDGDFEGKNTTTRSYGFVIKVDSDGELVWNYIIDKRSDFVSIDDRKGNLLVSLSRDDNKIAGDFIELDINGNLVWNLSVEGEPWSYPTKDSKVIAKADKEGNILYASTARVPTVSINEDIWISKVEYETKELQYSTKYSTDKNEYVSDVLFLGDELIVTGSFDLAGGIFRELIPASYDVYYSKFDSQGNLLLVSAIKGSGRESSNSILDYDDSIFITGYTRSNDGHFPSNALNDYTDNAFLARLNYDGEVEWVKKFGGSRDDTGVNLDIGDDGIIYLLGNHTSRDGIFKGVYSGESDVFLIKLNLDGELLEF